MRHKNNNRNLAAMALIGASLIWSFAFPLVKISYNAGLTSDSFLIYRFIFAILSGLPIIFYLYKKGQIKIKPKDILKIFSLEFFGTYLALLVLYKGVQDTSAVESSLIGATLPVTVTLAGIFLAKEKENKYEATGLLLSFIGTIFLILQPLLLNSLNGNFKGNLLVFSHNVITSFYYIGAKKYYKNYNKLLVVMMGSFLATTLLILTKPSNINLLNPTVFTSLSFAAIIGPIFMGILGTTVAFSLYLYGQSKIEASEASLFNYLNPLFAIPLSVILLGEKIGINEIIGGVLILVGLVLAQKRK